MEQKIEKLRQKWLKYKRLGDEAMCAVIEGQGKLLKKAQDQLDKTYQKAKEIFLDEED